MKARRLYDGHALIGRGLLIAAALARSESDRAQMAMQMRMLPPGMGGERRESWMEDDEDVGNPVSDGVTTFDAGMFGAIANLAIEHLKSLDLGDATQLGEVRSLLMMMQELCRERLDKQEDRKSVASRGWRLAGNLLSNSLQVIAAIDRTVMAGQANSSMPGEFRFSRQTGDEQRPRRTSNRHGEV